MTKIDILDRSSMTERLNRGLVIDPRETAIVTIDMHRGHLDPAVATLPTSAEDARRVIAAAKDVLDFARARGVPVVHVKQVYRRLPKWRNEGMSQPFWQAMQTLLAEDNRLSPGRRTRLEDHQIEGSPGTETMPEVYAEGDYTIDNKKRLDCFYGTDLRLLLDNLGAKTVCLMGINTNTCVLNTSFTAFNFNYRVVVLSDCVASMYGDDLHVLGLQNVARCLGWVIDNAAFKEKLGAASRA
ncbi:MAG TPA: cysteine hydrolase [Alphaproteobacteria bacterium]|nr:cysteine hydrolase [Alphaproteobacteria bacterium]